MPRILRERHVILVLGPKGVGKSSVAQRLASLDLPCAKGVLCLDTRQLQDALVVQVGARGWDPRLLEVPALVLDGPVWLHNRPAAVRALCELLRIRAERGLRTLVCQSDHDCSIDVLMGALEAGSSVVVGLRFPKGTRGRLRFARRVCEELDIPRSLARGSDLLEPWGYEAVIAYLAARKRRGEPAQPQATVAVAS